MLLGDVCVVDSSSAMSIAQGCMVSIGACATSGALGGRTRVSPALSLINSCRIAAASPPERGAEYVRSPALLIVGRDFHSRHIV